MYDQIGLPRTHPVSGNGQKAVPALSCVVRRIDSGGFVFREHHAGPAQKNPRHAHDYYCIGFVFGGEGEGAVGRDSWSCRAGSLNIIPAGTAHSEGCGPAGLQWCGIELPRITEAIQPQAQAAFARARQVSGGTAVGLARRILGELRIADPSSALVLHGLALELLAILARSSGADRRPPTWLARAKEYACTHFAKSLQLDDIAAEVGVHPLHLARTFRRHVGCSVGEYLRGLRLDAAIDLLRAGCPLSSIAQQAGFYDQAHFSRSFKRHTGLSPTEYRRLHH